MIRHKLQRFLFAEKSFRSRGVERQRDVTLLFPKNEPSLYIFYDYSIFIATIIHGEAERE